MQMVKSYTFSERFAMSQGQCAGMDVSDILLAHIPGALEVHKASSQDDRKGTDWWVAHKSGKRLSIDAKVREQDYSVHPNPTQRADDLALETYSVCEKEIPGWTRDASKTTDYVLWFWVDTARWCLLPFCMLCAVFQEHWQAWRQQYKRATQHTKERDRQWHSECVFVPRRLVWAEIYKRFAGHTRTAQGREDVGEVTTMPNVNDPVVNRIISQMPLWDEPGENEGR